MKTLPQVRQRFPKRHPLRWMACCFRNWSHQNQPSKPPPTTPFQDPSHENHPSPGPRSELFRTRVMKTPPQVRQHAIFKTRLPKRHPFRVDGPVFGTRVTKTSPPNHPPSNLFKTQAMKTNQPQVKDPNFLGVES